MALLNAYGLKSFVANISCLLSLPFSASAFAAEHLEIQIRLHTTWRSQTQTNKHETTVLCVLGTNDWYISGQFLRNAHIEYWLIGTNVLEHKVINSSMYLERAKDFISEKIRTQRPRAVIGQYPPKGQSSTRITSWREPFGYGVERGVWLAFCSGSFLCTPDRQIPLPLGHFSDAQGCTDKTVLLEDGSNLSPPKSVDLFARDGSLVCRYDVLASTNVLSRAFPLRFRLIQYGHNTHRVATNVSQSILLGEVTSMKPCERPSAPEIRSTKE